MAHFVKWRGAFNDQGSPKISHSIQGTLVGQAFRFGIWGGDGLDIGPNDPSSAQINPRATVEGSGNNILWYELVGLREANVMIEGRNPADRAVWDYFQLAVKRAAGKVRSPVRGVNYDYYVDAKGIGPDYNASMVLTLKLALTPLNASVAQDANGTNWAAQKWTDREWNNWVYRFQTLIVRNWSEKFWLAAPPGLHELEVPKPGGGKKRVNLHCVLKLQIVPASAAQHKIQVVKAKAPNGVAFRSDSTKYDDADLKADPPGLTGFAKPFTTAIHEIGHTLGLHHPCESSTPATPYCLASHPDAKEIMGTGNEYRARYATPWQNAAASWFNSSGQGYKVQPSHFVPSTYRIAPVDA